ncbi:MAG TPA: UPF0182 family protein [Gemmatimonadales bacterium]|nr:UPF0182 family protein [Gemmatimonadales bacterium]
MSRRGRRLSAALATLVILLFVGRWSATLLADRWWATAFSPAAADFLFDWHLLRLTLEVGGCLLAGAWFIGHLLLVYRAVGTVQVRRNVANLEFREALTPRALLTTAVVTGALLGLLVGSGTSGWWREVTLAWESVSYEISDPLLGRDLGVYVSQLPMWRAAHGFLVLLVLLALTGVLALYMLVGAIRWIERRPAINDHARSHLGWLLAALALTLAWGYLLEPYETVAGPAEVIDQASWKATLLTSPLLAGIALAAAVLSAVWAMRPKHALALSGWIVLSGASLVGHLVLPSLMTSSSDPVVDPRALEEISRKAFGLDELRDEPLERLSTPTPPTVPSLWNPAAVAGALPGDSSRLLALSPTVLTPSVKRRPVWLLVRSFSPNRLQAIAVADHRVTATGEALFYRVADTVPRPTPIIALELQTYGSAPGAPDYQLRPGDGPGVRVGGWPRRVILAWALQAGELLGNVPPGSRVDWRLSPDERLRSLAPFAEWSEPVACIVDGQLLWLLDGYLTSTTFPLTGRVFWRDHRIGSMRAAFLATVNAETGATHVYLQSDADALAEAWVGLSRGLVEPPSSMPEAVLRVSSYPPDLFRVQAKALELAPWKAGSVTGQPQADAGSDPPAPQVAWAADTSGPLATTIFESPSERRMSAVLVGSRADGHNHLSLLRLDASTALPVPGALEGIWSNFPSYDALNDSIREDGGKLERGPVRVDIAGGGLVAYQTYFAPRTSGGRVLAWVSVAAPGEGRPRVGAGRSLKEAWSNLLGATVPAPPGTAQTGRLDEARGWLQHADSALRRGDWEEFGRAWGNLRRTLGLPPEVEKF